MASPVHHDRIKKEILQIGIELGFRNPGITRVEKLPREPYFSAWLEEGRAGDMRFLEHHKEARLDPHSRFPWAQSIVSAAFPYLPASSRAPASWQEELRGRIASYALGRDYHQLIDQKLKLWAEAIATLVPARQTRTYVDTGPVLEHEWAQRAGVGWTGKHTLTLDREAGSWNFLGEILLELELEPDAPARNHCGTCTRCIDSCPTDAIRAPYDLDPRLCISYLTIEHKGPIQRPLREKMGEWLFGCDLCQIACPWNDTGEFEEALHPRLPEILSLDTASFATRFANTPLERTGVERLKRNAAIVAGNTRNPAMLPALEIALEDHSSLVREHATWAVGRITNSAKHRQGILEKMRNDPAPEVIREATLSLEETSS